MLIRIQIGNKLLNINVQILICYVGNELRGKECHIIGYDVTRPKNIRTCGNVLINFKKSWSAGRSKKR